MAAATNGRAGAEGALNVSDVWTHREVLEWQFGDEKRWNRGTGTLDNNGDLIFRNDAGIEIHTANVRKCNAGDPKSKRKGHIFAIRLDLRDGTKYILAPNSMSERQKWMSCLKLWSNKLNNLSFSIGCSKNVMSNLLVGEDRDPVHQIVRTTNIAEELSGFERRKREFPLEDCFTRKGFLVWYELREDVKRLKKVLETTNFTRVNTFDFSDETSLVVNITHIRTGTPETLRFNNDGHFGLHTCTGGDGTEYFICQTGTESSFPEQQLSVPSRTRLCLERCLERDALLELEFSDDEYSDEEDDDHSDDEDGSDFVLVQRDSGDGSLSDIDENPSSPSSNDGDDESSPVIPEGWVIHTDEESGNQYYWNESTQQSCWVGDEFPN